MVPMVLSTMVIIIQITFYKDSISIFILFIIMFYSAMCSKLLWTFHNNLDTFKETIRNIPVLTYANSLSTTLITPSTPSTPYSTSNQGDISRPTAASEYSSPSETWTSVSTPLATAQYVNQPSYEPPSPPPPPSSSSVV